MYTLICYKKCSTCRQLEKELKKVNIEYQYREITEDTPSASELLGWFHKSGETSIKKIMNTSGSKYRELNMKDQLKDLEPAQQLELIAQDGMLIKRPILLDSEGLVYIGPKAFQHMEEIMEVQDKEL